LGGHLPTVPKRGNGIFDFDNDGLKDLFAAGSAILDNSEEIDRLPYPLPARVFRNLGEDHFADVSVTAGEALVSPRAHRGAAFGDVDGDGRIDIVVNCLNAEPKILLNRSTAPAHWLILQLVGTRSNRDGLGARVTLRGGAGAQYNQATTSVGYNSASDKRVHFGLGAEPTAEIEVAWPSGARQTLRGVAADQVLVVREPAQP
jgi:hypothetical protein